MPEVESSEPPLVAAGEGGHLPRGLSLFRFILFSFLMLGAAYGGAALYFDAPPPPGYEAPSGLRAAAWEPSPVWLPTYAALKLGVGVAHGPEGYVFSSRLGHAAHAGCAIALGIALGGLAGWCAGESIRRAYLRRKNERIRQAILNGRAQLDAEAQERAT